MIDYSLLPLSKGTPRIVEKLQKRRELARDEQACRIQVDLRDGRRCFFPNCRAFAGEKHHIRSRSVRGKTVWHPADILSACTEHHRWFKAQLIRVSGNPERRTVRVHLTALGRKSGIRVPKVAA